MLFFLVTSILVEKFSCTEAFKIFTSQPLLHAQPIGPKIALHFPHLFVDTIMSRTLLPCDLILVNFGCLVLLLSV